MPRPVFTFWPWKVLSVAMPLLAAFCAGASGDASTARELKMTGVFFAVLGAGDAYIVSAAIGDLSRSVLSVPIAAIAGVAAVQAMQFPALRVAALLVIGISLVIRSYTYFIEVAAAMTVIPFLILPIAVALVPLALGRENPNSLGYALIYPLIVGVITVSMPLELGWRGRHAALLKGWLSAGSGSLCGVGMAVVLGTSIRPFAATGLTYEHAVPIIGFCTGNYICMHAILNSAVRVNEKEDPPDELPSEVSLQMAALDSSDSP